MLVIYYEGGCIFTHRRWSFYVESVSYAVSNGIIRDIKIKASKEVISQIFEYLAPSTEMMYNIEYSTATFDCIKDFAVSTTESGYCHSSYEEE